MGKLFGTDGVRGLANSDLTPELAFKLGIAGASVLTKEARHNPRILIADDTRLSGNMLEAALTAGMCLTGATVISAGSIPTPAVAYLVRKYSLDAGVMISASHNPFYDNGIKFFSSTGFKLSDQLENEIEELIENGLDDVVRAMHENIGRREVCESALDDYADFLVSTMDGQRLDGLKIALDCSNGATSVIAPLVFHRLGAQVFATANEPDGTNINRDCGSTHIGNLRVFAKEVGADIGFAFDGDGDRLISVDENADEVDGDMAMTVLAKRLRDEGGLAKDTVVATVMSNLGFYLGLENEKIKTIAADVGDRYVLEKMLTDGYNLGGEQSGHIIFLDHSTTGDGILTALMLAKTVKRSGKSLSELNCIMKKLPQVLVNAKVPNDKKNDFKTNGQIIDKINGLEKKYSGAGRVLIRPSGTEPLVRVTIEGKNQVEIDSDARELASFIEDCYK